MVDQGFEEGSHRTFVGVESRQFLKQFHAEVLSEILDILGAQPGTAGQPPGFASDQLLDEGIEVVRIMVVRHKNTPPAAEERWRGPRRRAEKRRGR
jgi:hypothetical protein